MCSFIYLLCTYVYRYNIEELRRAVLNGPEMHPGASIVRAETHQFLLQFADRTRVAANLKVRPVCM